MADSKKFGHSDMAYGDPVHNLQDPAFAKGLSNIGIDMPGGANGTSGNTGYANDTTPTNVSPRAWQSQLQKRGMPSNDTVGFANKAAGRGKK